MFNTILQTLITVSLTTFSPISMGDDEFVNFIEFRVDYRPFKGTNPFGHDYIAIGKHKLDGTSITYTDVIGWHATDEIKKSPNFEINAARNMALPGIMKDDAGLPVYQSQKIFITDRQSDLAGC